MRKILITGANGFIGGYVLDKLKECFDVYSVGRQAKQRSHYVQADIADDGFVDKICGEIPRCDVIIHVAALIDMACDEKLINVNCIGTFHICELANKWACEQIIYLSSIPVVGIPLQNPVTEQHSVKPMTLYHLSKYMGENILRICCNEDIRQVILRIPSPIGKGMNKKNLLSVIINKCKENQDIVLYGQGKRVQNYIDVRDITNAIYKALFYKYSALFNIANTSISNYDLAVICQKLSNADSNIVFSELPDREENNQWYIDSKEAEDKLDYMPQYTLDETISWIMEE